MRPPMSSYNQKLFPDGDVTQWFGENPDLYSRWGMIGHNGIDIVAPYGEPLYAVEDGTIINVRYDTDGYGAQIRLLSDEIVDGKQREWVYAHLSAIGVEIGDVIKAGDKVGEMGNSGFVVSGSHPWWDYNPYAGTHLHLGMRWAVLDKDGFRYHKNSPSIRILNYDNGYKGSVDIAHYFESTTTKVQTMMTLISLLNQLYSLLSTYSSLRKRK